jgi:hypothetical protein
MTNGVLGDSDLGKAEELLDCISDQVGRPLNIIACQIFQQKLESVDPWEWDAELLHEAFEE